MDELMHYGILGMKWGVRRTPEELGHRREKVFVSGSSKTEFKDSGYYRKKLPKPIRSELKEHMRHKDTILVGDAPGIDRQVQRFVKKYENVIVYGPGEKVRYSANKKWMTKPINAPEYEPGSKEWLAKKDVAMTNDSTSGLAVILDEGSSATRRNIQRLIDQHKDVKVYELSSRGKDFDRWVR